MKSKSYGQYFLPVVFFIGVFFIGVFFIGIQNAHAVAPEATNLSAAETYTEDVSLNLIDIVVSDIDSVSVTAVLTLSNTSVGSLSTATSNAVTSTYDGGTGVWTAAGPIADVNTLLAGVTFIPTSNSNGSFAISTSVTDGAGSVTGTKVVTGIAINDSPSATNLSAAETYTEDTARNLTDIVVTDVDTSGITVTLTLSNTSAGSLSTATSGAVTSTYIAGTGVWTATGAVSSVNTLLAGVTFTPSSNFSSNFTIATSVSDGVAAALTGSKAMMATSVNDAPVLDTSKSPVLSTVNENVGVPTGAVGTLVSTLVDFASPAGQVDNVADVDSGASLGIAVTAASTDNLTWYYTVNGGASWTALGAVSDSSARLLAADSNNRLYAQPSSGFSGTVAAALTFRAWDQTSGVDGGTSDASVNGGTTAFSSSSDTASLTVNPAAPNTAPVAEDDLYMINEDSVGVHLFVMTNDTDADDDVLTITAVTTPAEGSAEIEDDATVYVPARDYCGFDTYEYTIEDPSHETDTATVTIEIVCENDAPEATNLSASETYIPETPLDLIPIVITEPDSGDSATVDIQLPGNSTVYGTLSVTDFGMASSTFFPDEGRLHIYGPVPHVNTMLEQVTWTPPAGLESEFDVSVEITDGTETITGTKTFSTLDVVDPNTFITSSHMSSIDSSTATFEFSSNETPVTFECAIDTGGGPVFTACTSPFSSSLFLQGNEYTFLVRAKDASDNVDETPAEASWKVYDSSPEVVATDPEDGDLNVRLNKKIVYEFLEPVSEELQDHIITSADPCGGLGCPVFDLAWSQGGRVLTLTKDSRFEKNTEYGIDLSVDNSLGVVLSSIGFTTGEDVESSGSGGGVRYSCNDKQASNYQGTGKSNPTLCKYAAVSAPAVVTPSAPPAASLFTKNLTVGAVDAEVKALQEFLNNHGFPVAQAGAGSKGNEITRFGMLTKAALAKFQASKGIKPAVGYFGPITRGIVNTMIAQ